MSIYGLLFWVFVVIKFFGTALATWSWWWLLVPVIPDFWLLLHKLNVI